MYITAIKIDNERAALTITEPSQEAERYLLGDADGDGEVTIVDATYIQRYVTKLTVPFTEAQMLKGDIDGDGEVTVVDATFVQRYATRMNTPYPIGEYVVKA